MTRLLYALWALAALAHAGTETSRLLDQAEYLILNCHLDRAYLDSAAGLIAAVRDVHPDNQRSLYLSARLKIQQADFASDRSEQKGLYRAAQVTAESLKGFNDEDPRGHLLYGIALGRLGQLKGIVNSLAMLPTLKREFRRVLELDDDCTEAYEALGRLYLDVPGALGGDAGRAVEYFQAGLETNPSYTVLRLDLARALVRLGRQDEVVAQLDTLLATCEPYPPCDFALYDRPEAEKLLSRLRGDE